MVSRLAIVGAAWLALAGCSKPTTAAGVCESLASAGALDACHASGKGVLNEAASGIYEGNLVGDSTQKCVVMQFAELEPLRETVATYGKAAKLVSPNGFVNERALIFVQCDDKLPVDQAGTLRKVVGGL